MNLIALTFQAGMFRYLNHEVCKTRNHYSPPTMATEIPNDNAERAPSFEELPGANTQGATLEEAKENLQEAAAMILEANRELAEKSIAGQTVTREPFIPSS